VAPRTLQVSILPVINGDERLGPLEVCLIAASARPGRSQSNYAASAFGNSGN
jgi:hypothetical protein